MESWHILHLNVKQLWHHIVITQRADLLASQWDIDTVLKEAVNCTERVICICIISLQPSAAAYLFFLQNFSQLPKKLELLIIAQRKTANSKIGQSKCCSPQVDFVNLEIPGDDQNTESAQPPIWQTWLRSNISSKKCSFESPEEGATSAKSGCLTPVILSVTGGVVCCLSWFGDFGNPKLQIPNCPFSGCLLLMIVVIVGDDVDSWWW